MCFGLFKLPTHSTTKDKGEATPPVFWSPKSDCGYGTNIGEMESNYDKLTVEGEHFNMIGVFRLVATRLTCKHVDGSPNRNYTLFYVAFQCIVQYYVLKITMFISITHLRLFVVSGL